MDCIVHGVTKSWTQLSDFHLNTLMFSFNDNTTEAHYGEHFPYLSEFKKCVYRDFYPRVLYGSAL